MERKFVLLDGEKLLRQESVTFIKGKLRGQVGKCYLTDRRIVAEIQSMWTMTFGLISLLLRSWIKNDWLDISLRDLSRLRLEKYGLNHLVVLPLNDGTDVRMAFGKKQRDEWLSALDEALLSQNLKRTPDGENAWRITPAG